MKRFLFIISFILAIPLAFSQVSLKPPPARITYQIYSFKKVGSVCSEVIVIDPKNRNEKDLRTLGENIKADFKKYDFVYFLVFDTSKAAAMNNKVADLDDEEGVYYDKHFVASYTKNNKTGFHELALMINGPEDPLIIKY